ncbi:MAG: DUF2075 domain-containing protein [Nitrosopumilus sp.]|uniref:DUF2075 domain-containing protein n=1 Tax=Nitrosopumilus sp. TaxID=2024843 RepID=UPI00242D2BE9|nr:DUF2075 domain-containing protein [Nitrosopumilus sp.]MCV0365659.1 DUF2075 domain-containing protein [Nitrosopumilus sp.]
MSQENQFKRSYYSQNISDFLTENSDFILGILTKNHTFAQETQQRNAWQKQIEILKNELNGISSGRILFEYSIPRMGKRVDIILIYSGFVFVIEFKVNAAEYNSADVDQCVDYALDLKNFQEQSHNLSLVPILVSTDAQNFDNNFEQYSDGVFKPLKCNSDNLRDTIESVCKKFTGFQIDPILWENSKYKPTPTIIEAAQSLYKGHSVKEISRSDAGAINLIKTSEEINKIIEKSKKENLKSICFITGVPGSGKTLAGLNLANERQKFEKEEHAVFLSGNGPLVDVLQEALARNDPDYLSKKITKKDAQRKAKSFIQIIHHFRDAALRDESPPIEKVVVFDEAQRAWNLKRITQKMKEMKGVDNFSMSEPEFLIHTMDRHQDWTVIVCLIGGGQEINTGEAGLVEWFSSLKNHYLDWNVFLSTEISDIEYTRGSKIQDLLQGIKYESLPNLHLNVSIRSFRSEYLSKCVKAILDYDKETAKELLSKLKGKFPFVITRDINKAKQWIKNQSRGSERYGLIASSNGKRLRPYGIFVEIQIDAPNWFLNGKDDVRSSYYLEYTATEFAIQGLELDWTIVAWDADMRLENNAWNYYDFMGSKWRNTKDEENRLYHKNTYRVLLTRARQGQVIFIPKGDKNDHTRPPEFYDSIYNYFKELGIEEI